MCILYFRCEGDFDSVLPSLSQYLYHPSEMGYFLMLFFGGDYFWGLNQKHPRNLLDTCADFFLVEIKNFGSKIKL